MDHRFTSICMSARTGENVVVFLSDLSSQSVLDQRAKLGSRGYEKRGMSTGTANPSRSKAIKESGHETVSDVFQTTHLFCCFAHSLPPCVWTTQVHLHLSSFPASSSRLRATEHCRCRSAQLSEPRVGVLAMDDCDIDSRKGRSHVTFPGVSASE